MSNHADVLPRDDPAPVGSAPVRRLHQRRVQGARQLGRRRASARRRVHGDQLGCSLAAADDATRARARRRGTPAQRRKLARRVVAAPAPEASANTQSWSSIPSTVIGVKYAGLLSSPVRVPAARSSSGRPEVRAWFPCSARSSRSLRSAHVNVPRRGALTRFPRNGSVVIQMRAVSLRGRAPANDRAVMRAALSIFRFTPMTPVAGHMLGGHRSTAPPVPFPRRRPNSVGAGIRDRC